MVERMLEKKGASKRKIIFALLIALTLILSFVGTTQAEPSDDDNRIKGIQPVLEIKNHP